MAEFWYIAAAIVGGALAALFLARRFKDRCAP